MRAVRRALLALLIGEGVILFLSAPLALAIWAICRHMPDMGAYIWHSLLVPAIASLAAPVVAFGDGGTVSRSWDGKTTEYTGGGIYGHLRRSDEKEEAELTKLLEEHKP